MKSFCAFFSFLITYLQSATPSDNATLKSEEDERGSSIIYEKNLINFVIKLKMRITNDKGVNELKQFDYLNSKHNYQC